MKPEKPSIEYLKDAVRTLERRVKERDEKIKELQNRVECLSESSISKENDILRRSNNIMDKKIKELELDKRILEHDRDNKISRWRDKENQLAEKDKEIASLKKRIQELENRIPFEKRSSNPKNETPEQEFDRRLRFGDMAEIGNGMKIANLSQHEWELMKAYAEQAIQSERDIKSLSSKERSFNPKELLEKLAELEHQQWVTWSMRITKEECLSPARRERWERLWIPYTKLTEEQKEFDRKWARKVLALINELSEPKKDKVK